MWWLLSGLSSGMSYFKGRSPEDPPKVVLVPPMFERELKARSRYRLLSRPLAAGCPLAMLARFWG